MKKFVVLVLTLCLTLSIASVSFAADNSVMSGTKSVKPAAANKVIENAIKDFKKNKLGSPIQLPNHKTNNQSNITPQFMIKYTAGYIWGYIDNAFYNHYINGYAAVSMDAQMMVVQLSDMINNKYGWNVYSNYSYSVATSYASDNIWVYSSTPGWHTLHTYALVQDFYGNVGQGWYGTTAYIN